MIKAAGLTKDYGARRAIEALNFHADAGEIVGFLGPNGAGKTTTMRILTGYMPPSEGSAQVAGYDVVDESIEVRKRVGYLPETVPLYPDMTVFDYLKFMGDLRQLDYVEDRVDEIIETVEMEERADSYISTLSKGMRQRIGLAQALLHEPEVLILDEPTIGLDPAQILGVRKLIQNIGKERTVLLSTHILSEAQQICNRVLIINKGKIVAEDSPENLESHLGGAKRLSVAVAGKTSGLADSLKKVKGVTQVTAEQEGRFVIETSGEEDARPEIARTVIQGNFDLLEMRPVGMSLEEIFMQLTRDEDETAGGQELAEVEKEE